MPSDKHNLRTARARNLISSLINVASSRDVPFRQLQQLLCLHHGATFGPLWSPILSSQLHKVTICARHVMASVQNIQIAEQHKMLVYKMTCPDKPDRFHRPCIALSIYVPFLFQLENFNRACQMHYHRASSIREQIWLTSFGQIL